MVMDLFLHGVAHEAAPHHDDIRGRLEALAVVVDDFHLGAVAEGVAQEGPLVAFEAHQGHFGQGDRCRGDGLLLAVEFLGGHVGQDPPQHAGVFVHVLRLLLEALQGPRQGVGHQNPRGQAGDHRVDAELGAQVVRCKILQDHGGEVRGDFLAGQGGEDLFAAEGRFLLRQLFAEEFDFRLKIDPIGIQGHHSLGDLVDDRGADFAAVLRGQALDHPLGQDV